LDVGGVFTRMVVQVIGHIDLFRICNSVLGEYDTQLHIISVI